MRLNKSQREAVLQWIAEGLGTDEINRRASSLKPPFHVLRSQVDYYRKSRGVKLEEIQEQGEHSALTTGLALKENRVAKLKLLADKMLADLLPTDTEKWWLLQVKGIGSRENYERVEYFEFNKAELESLRGVLDDIAAEVGDRVKKSDVTSNGNPIQALVTVYIPGNNRK